MSVLYDIHWAPIVWVVSCKACSKEFPAFFHLSFRSSVVCLQKNELFNIDVCKHHYGPILLCKQQKDNAAIHIKFRQSAIIIIKKQNLSWSLTKAFPKRQESYTSDTRENLYILVWSAYTIPIKSKMQYFGKPCR